MLTHAEVVSRLKAAIERAESLSKGWRLRQRPSHGNFEIIRDPGVAGVSALEIIATVSTYDYALFIIRASRVEHPAAMKALLEIAERHVTNVDGTDPGFCDGCAFTWPCPDFRAVEAVAEKITP